MLYSDTDEESKLTKETHLKDPNLKQKLLDMTEDEVYEYLNNIILEAYHEGYRDAWQDI